MMLTQETPAPSHQYNGQPWGAKSGRDTRLNFLSNLRAHLLRNRFTVNNLCCHQREDSVCYIKSKGMWLFCQKRGALSVIVCVFTCDRCSDRCDTGCGEGQNPVGN